MGSISFTNTGPILSGPDDLFSFTLFIRLLISDLSVGLQKILFLRGGGREL